MATEKTLCSSGDNPQAPAHCIHPTKVTTISAGIETKFFNCCYCGEEFEIQKESSHGEHLVPNENVHTP